MSDIKLFIKEIFKFIPFAGILYLFILLFWGEVVPDIFHINLNHKIGSYGHLHSRIAEVKKTTNVDLLFLGSSHTYRGFDPRIFKNEGFTSFNLGSSAQTPAQTYVLLKRHLKQLNPKVIVYDTYPFTFTSDGIESSLDVISNDRNDIESIKLAFKQNHIKVYNTLVYGLYCDFFNRNASYSEPVHSGLDTYISGGYVAREITYFKNLKYASKEWVLKDEQLEAFEKIVRMTKENNIELILVQTPITRAFYSSYTNNVMFDQKMKSYGEYYNFNEILQLDDSLHFYDVDHMNQDGVNIFDAKFIDLVLKKNNKQVLDSLETKN